jgi:CxxC motif-containing protein (DUF1111 family)
MTRFSLSVCMTLLLAACGGSDSTPGAPPANTPAPTAAPEPSPAAADAALLASQRSSTARDPGVRGGLPGAGGHLAGLQSYEIEAFEVGKEDFDEREEVADGLGPVMNLDGCGACHSQPAVGGTSPARNPQFDFVVGVPGIGDKLPAFIAENGPIREARFVRNPDGSPDGSVHPLFTITGRAGATPDCRIAQPDFAREQARNNVIFRIPTPVFGAGLMEQIPDRTILANQASNASAKRALGIRGHANGARGISGAVNRSGNDHTISRFGWKAQNKSLLQFSGEAYTVEMGITNEMFQTELDETEACQYVDTPNSVTDGLFDTSLTFVHGISSIEKFALFMRLAAPPTASTDTPGGATSIANGRAVFDNVGCALCHTPALSTGSRTTAAFRNQMVNLFSDLLVHDMGQGLADGVSQGLANGREFRTAPLWGLGQRIFFLHDGRTSDLQQAILAHMSEGSEASEVTRRFIRLSDSDEQDLLNFLRSL